MYNSIERTGEYGSKKVQSHIARMNFTAHK